MLDPFPIAIEHVNYHRENGQLRSLVSSVKRELEKEGFEILGPEDMSPDEVTAWLAVIYIGYVYKDD